MDCRGTGVSTGAPSAAGGAEGRVLGVVIGEPGDGEPPNCALAKVLRARHTNRNRRKRIVDNNTLRHVGFLLWVDG